MTATERRCDLPSSPASAGDARRFVESALDGTGAGGLAYAATLLVSELVANAVLHAGTPVELVVAVDGHRARVEVHDGSPQLPVRKHYSNLSGTGRGLMMVDRMASQWGAKPTAGGKVVWFELDADAALGFDVLQVDAI